MATFIELVNRTDHGVRQIRQTTERAKTLIKAASNLASMGALSNIRTQTLRPCGRGEQGS